MTDTGKRDWNPTPRPGMTAEERGMEMMHVPIGQLPKIAQDFCQSLCAELGGCMEVFLTAWTVYAQCVEALPCTDELYMARLDQIAWFKERI